MAHMAVLNSLKQISWVLATVPVSQPPFAINARLTLAVPASQMWSSRRKGVSVASGVGKKPHADLLELFSFISNAPLLSRQKTKRPLYSMQLAELAAASSSIVLVIKQQLLEDDALSCRM